MARERMDELYRETHGVSPSEIIIPSSKHRSQYEIHGLTRIPVVLHGIPSSIAIDVSPFPFARFAWFRNFARESMYVVVSSGRQEPPNQHKTDGFVLFDLSQTVEGLVVKLHYYVSPRRQIPYDAKLEPIYRKG